jgi:uncharacterized membrane protein YgdD (TMEM256/DUF423 family)
MLGASGVAFGAFGAHALKATLTKRGTMDSWRTAVMYQLIHSIALLAVSTRERDHKSTVPYDTAATLWTGGTVLFSGSIYALSLGVTEWGAAFKIIGPITPLGGLLMIGGWISLGFGTDTFPKPE